VQPSSGRNRPGKTQAIPAGWILKWWRRRESNPSATPENGRRIGYLVFETEVRGRCGHPGSAGRYRALCRIWRWTSWEIQYSARGCLRFEIVNCEHEARARELMGRRLPDRSHSVASREAIDPRPYSALVHPCAVSLARRPTNRPPGCSPGGRAWRVRSSLGVRTLLLFATPLDRVSHAGPYISKFVFASKRTLYPSEDV
jgi:hypothetical protein